LRQSIREFTLAEPKLLDSIGTAHMEHEIQKRVLELTRKNQRNLEEETGIQSSLTDDDMKHHLGEVIEEIKKGRPNHNNRNG
jgi:hypothetical protein